MNSASNYVVSNNPITNQNFDTFFPWAGIRTRHTNRCLFLDNVLVGDGIQQHTGIDARQTELDYYDCNDISNYRTGAYFAQIHSGSVLTQNTFRPPFRDGLVYESGVEMDEQLQRGNRWLAGNYVNAAAVNRVSNIITAPQDLESQQYTINCALYPEQCPPSFDFPFLAAPTDFLANIWFLQASFTELEICGDTSFEPFEDGESQAEKDIKLWHQLSRGLPRSIGNSLTLPPFAQALPVDLLDMLTVEYNKQNIHFTAPILQAEQQSLRANILTQAQALFDLSETAEDEETYQTERAILLTAMQATLEDIMAVQAEMDLAHLTAAEEVKLANEAIFIEKRALANQQSLNKIYLAWQAAPAQGVIDEEETLFNIANQCPTIGGDAVYWARSLYQLIDPSQEFSEDCLNTGIGQGSGQMLSVQTAVDVEVYPNPTTGQLQIRLPASFENGHAELIDVHGRLVSRTAMSTNKYTLDISSVVGGVYWLRLIGSSDQVISTTRIVKQ